MRRKTGEVCDGYVRDRARGLVGGPCLAEGQTPPARRRPRGLHAALTGLGEGAHPTGPDVDLETHIRDVVGVLEYEDLQEAVLVGHSYGGMVITGAADRITPRLAELVYFDAEVPEDGQSELDLLAPDERATYEELARNRGDGWRIPPPVPETLPDDLDPDIRWVLSRMVPQP